MLVLMDEAWLNEATSSFWSKTKVKTDAKKNNITITNPKLDKH